jgi:hypothetical protein
MPINRSPEFIEDLTVNRRRKVLKVAGSEGVEYTWGSREVRPNLVGTRFLLSDLVESDKFDVEFLHPVTAQYCVMPAMGGW